MKVLAGPLLNCTDLHRRSDDFPVIKFATFTTNVPGGQGSTAHTDVSGHLSAHLCSAYEYIIASKFPLAQLVLL
ncbi:hypothetical protein E2C01_081649 [Portunus trituberculatus]|uniref:Uncharacterized protein n=1 Tax=Portunus trituberculatus TaxID=210409 RepID=A0A5B7IX34_PORTR|nr:hypothetical protein [Portunus trituberculatus]